MRRHLIELIFTVALDVFLAAFPPHAQLYRRASRMGCVSSGVVSSRPLMKHAGADCASLTPSAALAESWEARGE
jgi:hypothetical protein